MGNLGFGMCLVCVVEPSSLGFGGWGFHGYVVFAGVYGLIVLFFVGPVGLVGSGGLI